MWVLDPQNSPDLLARLRPHAVADDLAAIWCGEGWRHLVSDCHEALVAAFPDYRFTDIKQKWGVLTYQASPGANDDSLDARRIVQEITDRFSQASELTCEWCARPGSLREREPEWLTLCDLCVQDLATTPYPRQSLTWPRQ